MRTSEVYASSGPSQAYSETSVHARHASAAKPIPTGPRAQKRARVAQASVSPQEAPHGGAGSPRRNHAALPAKPRQGGSAAKMEEDGRGRGRVSPERERHRERGRERERERERGREQPPHQASRRSREREREREHGGRRSGGGRDRRGTRGSGNANGNANRGLVERMGL